jgi:acyl-CoA reductase-like NAD-dependent aldehyde dehydrogenase
MLIQKTKLIKVGRYDDPQADIGPLINKRQYDNYFKFLNIANKENLKLSYGRSGLNLKQKFDRGFFVDPIIFRDVPDDSLLAREEIFAPILAILKPFKSTYEAVERTNDCIYGLASGVFTSDPNKIEYFVRNVETGSIYVNCYNLSPYNVPFGGMKQSGFGRDNGQEGITEFTQIKSVYYYTDLSKI